MLIDPKEVHLEAWASGGQRADSGDRRHEARGNSYPGAGARFKSSVCSGLSADLKRLEPSVELLSVPLDVQSPTIAIGTVVRVIGLPHRSITSRSLVEATLPG